MLFFYRIYTKIFIGLFFIKYVPKNQTYVEIFSIRFKFYTNSMNQKRPSK
jgi:hypothetical protein